MYYRHSAARNFLMVLLAVCACAVPMRTRAADAGALAPDAPRKTVFAHYMACYMNTVEFNKSEIELAQRHGIDGFALNCGQWGGLDAKTKAFTPGNYTQACERMYEAAKQLNSGFRLFMSADVNGLGDLVTNMGDMVTRFEHHPNQCRYQNRTLLSAWAGGPDTFRPAVEALNSSNHPVCFIPFLYNARYSMAWSFETALKMFENQPYTDGLFYFVCDAPFHDAIETNSITRRATLFKNKLYMAGASPSYNSANLRDMHGLGGYDAVWQGIIRDDADFVELVTWNDYNEDSNLMPFRWPGAQEKAFLDHDESMLDATGYYSAYYKTGVRPHITQDKMYITYRNRSKWQRQTWDPKTKQFVDMTTTPFPFDQMHDDVLDQIYVSTFLTEPAQLTVHIGTVEHKLDLPAGISHQAVPLSPGVPQFVLARGGKTLADVIGRKEIIRESTQENSAQNGLHLLNRAWTAGVAVGPAIHVDAAAGKLHGNAVLQNNAVSTTEESSSGATFPMKDLTTATYNVRVTFCNPSDVEARLTISADGPSRAATDAPHMLPVFFPPTGKDHFVTTSFFWSLYSSTTQLTLEYQLGKNFGTLDPTLNDKGKVLIQSIDLIKVDPVKAEPPVGNAPELVAIPGGSFNMGSTVNPTESPVHKVTLSPFAIGKCEVTNEQFERFDTAHRAFRDGYSWRNQDPVIYVSWPDAVKYCNALSKAQNLTPAYDEKTWELVAGSNGYRLPTEAQWEYVASGRDMGRKFPWGDEAPSPRRANVNPSPMPQNLQPQKSSLPGGTTVVGSYPEGASRDGVLDLAGNVSEWCQDYLNPYTAAEQTDPVSNTPSNFRTIRGGSWGYYNESQRCQSREFNNPNYPGYIYIGFRVVLPDAGYKKLTGK